jgi:hypothetical protein
MRWSVCAVLVLGVTAIGCPGKQGSAPSGSGSQGQGTGAPIVTNAKTCDDVRGKLELLYRAEGELREPKRIDEFVADNTAMVLADCAREPARFVPCIARAQSVNEVEKQCVVPLDDDGTEAEAGGR